MLGDAHGHANTILKVATCDAFQVSVDAIPALCDWCVWVSGWDCFHLVLSSGYWVRWFSFAGKYM